jgi:hypothetical protein
MNCNILSESLYRIWRISLDQRTSWPDTVWRRPKKQWPEKAMCRRTVQSSTMTTVAQVTTDTTNNLTPSEKPSFERAIDLAFERIPAEWARQREV